MSALDSTEQEVTDGEEVSEFRKLKSQVVKSWVNRGKWRAEAIRAFDFKAGRQWSEEDEQILKNENRPTVTFNRTAPIIKAVCGLEVNNRQGVVFLPRTVDDTGKNDMYSQAGKWMRDETDADFEESEAFHNLAVCGEGWVENRDEVDGKAVKYIEECIDSLEMGANYGATKANYADARLLYRVRDLDVFDAKDMFPAYNAGAIHCRWIEGLNGVPQDGGEAFKKDYPDATRPGLDEATANIVKCRVVHVQWWEREDLHLVYDGEKLHELNTEEFTRLSERSTAAGLALQSTKTRTRVYYEAFLGNDGILLDADGVGKRRLPKQCFSWNCMTGERDRTGQCFYGLLRDMFDPQMWANKWLAQTMNILNSNAKGGIIAERGAFENDGTAEAQWSDPTKIIYVKAGAISGKKIMERNPMQLPQGLNDLMVFALSSLRDTTGVNLELLGQADREQAASLEAQRRQSAITILATLFNSKRRFTIAQGRTLLEYIKKLPPKTLVRVVDAGVTKYAPFVADPETIEYDVIVDEAPSSPNQKQFVWAMIVQLLQSGVQLSQQAIMELLKYSPLPESVVAEVMKSMGMGTEMDANQLQQQLMEAEQALKIMEQKLSEALKEADEARDDRSIEMMKLELQEYDSKTKRLQAIWSSRLSAAQALIDAATVPGPEVDGEEGGEQSTAPQQQMNPEQLETLKSILSSLDQEEAATQGAPIDPEALALPEENENASAE